MKNILFDFDGVLVESLNIKGQAFFEIYQKRYGKKVAHKVFKHHIENGGMSRFDKFRYYEKKYAGIDISKHEIKLLSEEFSKHVVNKTILCNEVVGSTKFIVSNKNKYNYWVISATPHEEINFIVTQRKIREYFVNIYGSPQSKEYWIKHLKSNGLNKSKTVFIGDALADYKAANNTGIKFILRQHNQNKLLFKDIDVIKINDLRELSSVIDSE